MDKHIYKDGQLEELRLLHFTRQLRQNRALIKQTISLAYGQPRVHVPEYYTYRGKLREPRSGHP